jgi:hypothetical protein
LASFFDRLAHPVDDCGTILITTPDVESLAARLRFLLLNQLKHLNEGEELAPAPQGNKSMM